MADSLKRQNAQLSSLSNGKINCDKIINSYLQSSLSPKIQDQVQQTKSWLKCNQKYAKQMIKQAEEKLKKTLETSNPSAGIFSPDSNSITNIMMATTGKFIPKKLFNQNEMEKVIIEKQTQRFNYTKKKNHNKKIDSYLKLISKLQKHSQKQENKDKNRELHSKNKQNKLPYEQKLDSIQNQTDQNQKQGYSKISSIERCSIKHRPNKNPKDLSTYNSLNSSQIRSRSGCCYNKQISPTQGQVKYHPFLERNLTMLYQAKRKRYRKGKFFINQNTKNGTYF